jgi:hypothetical protein
MHGADLTQGSPDASPDADLTHEGSPNNPSPSDTTPAAPGPEPLSGASFLCLPTFWNDGQAFLHGGVSVGHDKYAAKIPLTDRTSNLSCRPLAAAPLPWTRPLPALLVPHPSASLRQAMRRSLRPRRPRTLRSPRLGPNWPHFKRLSQPLLPM